MTGKPLRTVLTSLHKSASGRTSGQIIRANRGVVHILTAPSAWPPESLGHVTSAPGHLHISAVNKSVPFKYFHSPGGKQPSPIEGIDWEHKSKTAKGEKRTRLSSWEKIIACSSSYQKHVSLMQNYYLHSTMPKTYSAQTTQTSR